MGVRFPPFGTTINKPFVFSARYSIADFISAAIACLIAKYLDAFTLSALSFELPSNASICKHSLRTHRGEVGKKAIAVGISDGKYLPLPIFVSPLLINFPSPESIHLRQR